jgi:hypothetical protein
MVTIVFLSVLAVAAIAAVVTTFADVHRDGYRPVSTLAH